MTRYPEPGKAKTRLIPALGAPGAAKLHRYLVEYTLAEVDGLQRLEGVSPVIYFTGACETQMQDWLGINWDYQVQGNGDLGQRMADAFQASFEQGYDLVVLIGTDCLELKAAVLLQAFEQCEQGDLVLGPAQDGGYYLIGLCRLIPELFVGVEWGSSRVFEQTIAIAQSLNLTVTLLPMLADLDRPEDLANYPIAQILQGGED